MEHYTPVLAAATALVAVIVGPLITVYVTRMQVRAATVTASRLQWIETFQDQVSKFQAALAVEAVHRTLDDGKKEGGRTIRQNADTSEVLFRLQARILMLLKPGETSHMKFGKLISTSLGCLADAPDGRTAKAIAKFHADVLAGAVVVLMDERDLVEALK